MLHFFKNIRLHLTIQNKVAAYIRYAIGEIVLVVIGILIALQINNWNQDRKEAIEAQNIFKNLNNEFKVNRDQLQKDIDRNNESMVTGKILMDLMGSDENTLRTKNLDSLIFQSLENGDVNFSENTILELVQSGKMQYIKNDSIKNLIFEWTQKKEAVVISNERLIRTSGLLLSFLYKRYPLKNIDAYGVLHWKEPSKLKIDKLKIFSDVEFESLMDDFLYQLHGMISRQKTLQINIEQIIKATEHYQK